MARYVLTHAAQDDIVGIIAWSLDGFGGEAGQRYQALITAAIQEAASRPDDLARTPRPELGEGVFTWHLSQSRGASPGGLVRRPRHFLIGEQPGEVLIIIRVLHDAMDLRRHLRAPDSEK